MKIILSDSYDEMNLVLQTMVKKISENRKLILFSSAKSTSSYPDFLRSREIPRVENLDFLDSDEIYLFISSKKFSEAESFGRCKNIVAVKLRSEAPLRINNKHVLLIDDYAQLDVVMSFDKYDGLRQLFTSSEQNTAFFKNSVIKSYSRALDVMNEKKTVAIFGAQRLGEAIFDSLTKMDVSVDNFIDNNSAKHGQYLKGELVVSLDKVSKDQVIVIATTKYTYSIKKQLVDNGYENVIPYSVLSLISPSLFPDEIPYVGIQQDFAENAIRYLQLLFDLEDEKSRHVLNGLVNYRLTYDPNYTKEVSDEESLHYFDPDIISLNDNEIFVDLGGYDGDTVEKFIMFSESKFKRIYMFEPDQHLVSKAKARLIEYKNIEFIPAGAFSFDGDLKFSSSGRTDGTFSEGGQLSVPVRSVDSILAEAPTFIKMDIEGSESEALDGSLKWIKKSKPRLAIAAYHKASDLWQLLNQIKNLNPNYKFYLRHYSETGLETVIYAI